MASKSRIEKNLQTVRQAVADACARARRDPGSVGIVAVTKTASIEQIKSLLELGVTELGESRVQQLAERAAELGGIVARKRGDKSIQPRWHMVGHLQRNKVRQCLEFARVIESIDSLRLAEEVNLRAERLNTTVDAMIEVNCSNEPQKFGVAVGAAGHLAELLGTLRHLRLIGLMTMAPQVRNPEDARPTFARLRELFEDMRHAGAGGEPFRHLSMGMSQDYPIAVEEGATMLRIGSALFA